MPDIFNFTDEMQEYFDTLPPLVRESIKESYAKVSSLEDLKKCAENLMSRD